MRAKLANHIITLSLMMGIAIPATAAQIDFTGGTVELIGGGTAVTNGTGLYQFTRYEENGFELTTLGSSIQIGDYYGASNDVIHGHWAPSHGDLTMIKFNKVDNSSFDLNYFVLTSNTFTGGGPANGTERVFIHASVDGTTSSYSQLLPSEDWGFPSTSIFLGSQFDDIKAFWFTSENDVYCFGMDEFYLDEAAPVPNPSEVPEPGTFALLGLGVGAIVLCRRK